MAQERERKLSLRSEAASARLKEYNVQQDATEVEQVRQKLESMRADISETLVESSKVLVDSTKLLVKVFAKIPPEELSERIAATFKRYDTNSDGTLQRQELRNAFKEMGKELSDEEIAALIAQYDVNQDDCFDLAEFEHLVRQTLEVRCTECGICKVMQARLDAALAEERRLEEEMNANKEARVKAKEEALKAARERRMRLAGQYKAQKPDRAGSTDHQWWPDSGSFRTSLLILAARAGLALTIRGLGAGGASGGRGSTKSAARARVHAVSPLGSSSGVGCRAVDHDGPWSAPRRTELDAEETTVTVRDFWNAVYQLKTQGCTRAPHAPGGPVQGPKSRTGLEALITKGGRLRRLRTSLLIFAKPGCECRARSHDHGLARGLGASGASGSCGSTKPAARLSSRCESTRVGSGVGCRADHANETTVTVRDFRHAVDQ
eukprot:CAMPEP_0202855182 /NCGR_PEP_ID=MMETSP1389-20130828/91381_1 /ASSEMBLY_ACC=CAM_ASM_000865 /TAXON_ID=302021 /ORGANISM="Rhodomonas sp., Strain CCMP768" /LENGTH=435 /DNA_ID=CAMNT_0049533791 /DNA_START=20 /DNA_END=1324 /DNA_ORIENTATION=+